MPDTPIESAPEITPEEQERLNREEINRVVNNITRLLNFRRPYDERRSWFDRQFLGQRTRQFFPDKITPRSNTFVQYPHSNVEAVVTRTMDAFFGYEEWFEVTGKGAADDPAAEAMQKVLKQILKASNFRACFEDLVRGMLIYGHGGLKVDWDWGKDVLNKKTAIPFQNPDGSPVMDPKTGAPVIKDIKAETVEVPRMRPRFTAIDVYDLLVDPDGGMAAQIIERTYGTMVREASQNPELYFPEALEEIGRNLSRAKDPDNVLVRMAELWDEWHDTCTLITIRDDWRAVEYKDKRASFRSATYTSYRREVYGGAPVIVWRGNNPHNHKLVPILHTSYIRLPGQVYGLGVIEPISEMSESMSKFMNMIVDNWNMGINKRFAFDVEADIDHEALNNLNVPGGKVGVVGDPTKVLFPLPTNTPSPGDYTILQYYKGLIEMTSGISDFYSKGTGSGGGNKTATGINQIIGETNFKFKLFIQNLEWYVVQPMLQMVASMIQQYVPDRIEVQITDAAVAIPKHIWVSPEELIGNYSFDLVAANYVTNKVIKQRNLLAFANLVKETPYLNQYEGLKELAKAFEIKNVNRIIKTPEQVEQERKMALAEQLQIMEAQAAIEAKYAAPKAGSSSTGGTQGRPRTAQLEGAIPGASTSSATRSQAQSTGANAMGLAGLGDANVDAI